MATTYYCGAGQAQTNIAQVNALSLVAGDSVLFNRSEIFRGTLAPKSGSSSGYIIYGAYGNGAKPLILGSKQENQLSDWTDLGGNIWSNNDSAFTVQVGNLILNNEALCGVKCALESDLSAQGEFWYDTTNHLVKIYSVGNPASVYTNIECALKPSANGILSSGSAYIIFDGLDFRYSGVGTIFGGSTSYIIVKNCNFSFNGGCYQTGTTRYGGGIGTWNSAHDWLVEKCTFDNEYDAATTNQGNSSASIYNIVWRNNLISNCEYSFEFWISNASAIVNGIYFENNTCLNAGGGWGHSQRSNPNGRHIMMYSNTATTSNVFVRNNIFYNATDSGIRIWSASDLLDITLNYNDWYVATVGLVNATTYTILTDWQATTQDTHSIALDPLLTSDYKLQKTSPCIDAGVNLPEVTDDYDGVPRGSATDIGAFEYWSKRIKNATLKNCQL